MPNSTPLPPLTRVNDPGAELVENVLKWAPVPLLPGEKLEDFVQLAGRVVGAAHPQDAIEEMLIRDTIDLTWEIFRLRRIKVGMIKASAGQGVRELFDSLGSDYIRSERLGESWASGDIRARGDVEARLKSAGMTIDEITAKTVEVKLEFFERLDRMLASAEARRNNALREIDRHRDSLGAAARRSIHEIEDAEFQDLAPGESAVVNPS